MGPNRIAGANGRKAEMGLRGKVCEESSSWVSVHGCFRWMRPIFKVEGPEMQMKVGVETRRQAKGPASGSK